MDLARLTPQPQIKAAKNRGILTANYANHAKENAAERGWAGLTAGNGERDRTSFLVTPSVLLRQFFAKRTKTCVVVVRAFPETSLGKRGFATGRLPTGFFRCDQHVGFNLWIAVQVFSVATNM